MTESYSKSMSLATTAPFDFGQSLAFLGEFPPMQGEHSIVDGTLTRALMVNGQPLGFSIHATGTPDQPEMACTIYSATPLDEATTNQAIDRISFHLSLADDLAPLYAAAQNDPPFRAVVQHRYGLHQVKFPSPFENACWAVLTQRNPLPIARKMKQQLIAAYGGSITIGEWAYTAFPEAGQVPTDPETLAALLGNAQKAGYIAALATAFRQVDEQWLRHGDYAEVEAWLLKIKGIGAWSAKFVLIRGLGRTEHISAEGELLNAAERVYGPPMTAERIATLAAPYGAMRGYWSYYLRNA